MKGNRTDQIWAHKGKETQAEEDKVWHTFSHLADAFIKSDLQMRRTEAFNGSIKTTKNRYKTKKLKLYKYYIYTF